MWLRKTMQTLSRRTAVMHIAGCAKHITALGQKRTSAGRFRSDRQPQLSDEPLRITARAIRDTEHRGAVCGILSGAAERAGKAPARRGEHAPTVNDQHFIGTISRGDERPRCRIRTV